MKRIIEIFMPALPTPIVCCVVLFAAILEAYLSGAPLVGLFLDPRFLLVYAIGVVHILYGKVVESEWLDAFGYVNVTTLQLLVVIVA
tara:strand:+ start:482 stop:742 length:261 start_codon:yes stop_codon:yes gene_type:complete